MTNRFVSSFSSILLLLWLSPTIVADESEEKPKGGPVEFQNLKFRLVGPAVGGRVARACGVAGDPYTFYAATASGGVWKSSDGGFTWKPVFDDQPITSIGSIAIAPSDSNVIYVGSGEANIRGNVAPGNGIYKSTDAGKTWKLVWAQEGQIGTMIVHPTNADVAFAAVLGHAFGPNRERGVFRTTDGGKTWQPVLAKNSDTGASDICFDPTNPKILFAGLWQARRRPWDLTSGGPGSGLYTSRDGGDTWKQVSSKDLPTGIWGKVCVVVAPSDGKRVYAMIEAEKGGLFRSDDGGESWKLASAAHYIHQRPWYFSTITVDPRNPDVVWCPSVRMYKSGDGGKTFQPVKGMHHGDNHDLWIDPKNPERMINSNDGGLNISTTGGQTWFWPPMPLSQFYHVAVDNQNPYQVSGCMQDLGTAAGPSNSLSAGGIGNEEWHDVGGGEAGFTAHDPSNPNVVYAGEYGGYISRYDHLVRQAQNVSVYPTNPSGHGGEDLRYRFQWTSPILISPHDPKVVYHAANVLFKTTDGGIHWAPISPDLTRNDKTKQKWAGGPITGDNTGVEIYCTIFAIAESPKQKDLLWAGSDDGLVHVSRDGGKSWVNVTANIDGIPEWGTVSCIEPSPFDPGTAYVVVDAHRMDNMKPYLFKTTDFGKTWTSLATKLAPDVYLHAIREDPMCKGLLFAGTERGIALSADDGITWRQLKLNFPPVPVHDLLVKTNDLVAATHGRSIWIFDDLTPIRQWTARVASAEAHLFQPLPATRWRYHNSFGGKSQGQNPPNGAVFHYQLKKKPTEEVTLTVTDTRGNVVIKLSSKPEKEAEKDEDPDGPEDQPKKTVLKVDSGLHRVVWDLRYKGADKIKGAKIDLGDPGVGPLACPGTYSVKMSVAGKTLTSSLVIQPDPRVHVAAADLNEQVHVALALRDDISRLTRLVQQIRTVRGQITARNELLKDEPKAQSLVKLGKELCEKLSAVEGKLHNPKAEITYDILAQKGGAQLYSKMCPLYSWIIDCDAVPTLGMREILAENLKELNQHSAELNALITGDVAKLNNMAKTLEIPNIILPTVPLTEKTH